METTSRTNRVRPRARFDILLILAMLLVFATSAQAALFRVGPTDVPSPPGNGFPLWYQDNNGLVLELCLPRNTAQLNAGACLILPPAQDPVAGINLPLVFPTNFPDESFYYAATSIMDIDANNSAELVIALEAAFGLGPAAANDQVVFGRLRIRVDAPVAGNYTITHPYGERIFSNVAAGRRTINFTEDIGIGAPGDFTGALNSTLGPFLRRSATEGGAPLGPVRIPGDASGDRFLSSAAAPVLVTGSPFNTNFFRVCTDAAGGLDGAGTACQTLNRFTLVGKVSTTPIGSPLTINRSTYSRDAGGAHVDVQATSTAQPGAAAPRLFFADAAGTNLIPSKLMRGPGALGLFYGQSVPFAPATLPASIIVTNLGDNPPSSATRALVDDVQILEANYDPALQQLTITATSSDKLTPPALTAVGLPASVTGSDALVAAALPGDPARMQLVYTLPAGANQVPPLTVNVASTAGGQSTKAVSVSVAGGVFQGGGPVAVDDTVTVAANGGVQSVNIPVRANDRGITPTNVSIITPPQSGTATVNATTGVITYNFAAPATAGTYTFTYMGRGAGGVRSNVATVTIIAN